MPASTPVGPHRPLVLWGRFPRSRRARGWRWAWAVSVPYPNQFGDSRQPWEALGIARTEADAYASADEVIEAFWPGARRGGSMHKFAREAFAVQARCEQWNRPRRSPHPTDPRPLEFVWRSWTCDGWCQERNGRPGCSTHSTPYLIVKRTRRYVVIERDAYKMSRARLARLDVKGLEEDYIRYGYQTHRLDRVAFERDGAAWAGHEYFYRTPHREPAGGWAESPGPLVQQALEVLGLTWPTTHREVVRAYRRRARETHPDRGGAPAAFRQVHGAFSLLRASLPRLQPDDLRRGAR
jgi:hypothetical protein